MLNPEQEWSRTNFIFGKQLGTGQFGTVYEAVDRESSRLVAIKLIAKNKITSPVLYQRLQRQIEIHSRLRHQSICKMYGYFVDNHHVYLVLEHCPNGSLYLPIKQVQEKLSDGKICQIVRQILSAISYLNLRNVMHRDIKLENLLFDLNYDVKLTDFGCSIHSVTNRRTLCGTIEYLCPEMISQQVYDHGVDLYCLGIVTFELFYFASPFYHREQQQIYKSIREGVLNFDDRIRVVPECAKQFIRILLKSGTKPKPIELLNHQFLNMFDQQGNKRVGQIFGLDSSLAEVEEEDVVCGTCTTKKGREREDAEMNELIVSFGRFQDVYGNTGEQ